MQKVFFMSNQTILYLPIDEIIFIQWRNRKLYVHTKDTIYPVSGYLKQYTYLLKHHFKKINRNTMINYNVITYIDK
ncbi:MAG: LytTR family transcriptional regulator DNA-binding domain-containing protein [Erysipelotrichaceae bacterium]|nr:LytTR family transcriptional regulator DNA-binding domain-containing protein [Erysipelotrichaceae bacterium]